jgi:cytochrome P450
MQIACSPWISLWVWLKPRGLDKLLDLTAPAPVRSWYTFVADCQESRAKKQYAFEKTSGSEARKDFFHWLWEAKDPETGISYSLPELNSECELLILAGSDTTATVLSACLFYLCRNKDVQENLTKEILDTFSSYDDIKGVKLSSCRYFTAFLQETMRMAPPFGANANRVVLPGGTTVDGKYLPEGSLVSSAVWAMQYNPEYYPSPLRFRPERWIVGEQGSTEESVALAESAFSTFSTGPRGCVGKNMAMLEMRIVVAKLIWKFDIRQHGNLGGGSPDGEWGRQMEGQYQTWDISVANRKGPLVQFKERVH